MKNEEFIQKLSQEPRKNKIESSRKRFFKWFLSLIFCFLAGFSFLGIREEWRIVFKDPQLLMQNILLILIVISASFSALVLSSPGSERKKSLKFFVLTPVFLWGVLLLFSFHQSPIAGNGYGCLQDILLFSTIPAILLFLVVKKGATILRSFSGFLILIASTSAGAWALQFTCHNDGFAHLLVWHFIPVATLGALGSFLGKKILRKI